MSNTENKPDKQVITDSALLSKPCLFFSVGKEEFPLSDKAFPNRNDKPDTVKRLVIKQNKRVAVIFWLLKTGVNTAKDKKT